MSTSLSFAAQTCACESPDTPVNSRDQNALGVRAGAFGLLIISGLCVRAAVLAALCQHDMLPGAEEHAGGVSMNALMMSSPCEHSSATGMLASGILSASSATTALPKLSFSACTVFLRASLSGPSVLGTMQAAPKLYLYKHGWPIRAPYLAGSAVIWSILIVFQSGVTTF